MSVTLAGRVPATFEIKSAQLPLVSLLLKSADLTALAEEFAARFGDLPDFFDHDPLLIDLSPLAAQPTTPDFAALATLMRNHRLHPVAARGGSAEQMAAALRAGLASGSDARVHAGAAVEAAPASAAVAPEPTPPTPAADAELAAPRAALVVDRPLRSGQQVYARGRDLVVTAAVNPGAEVIADGHIHVYAPLRGRAIAGARGDETARIFALGLQPELLAIAGVWRTGDMPVPEGFGQRPSQVRLDGGSQGRLVIERLG